MVDYHPMVITTVKTGFIAILVYGFWRLLNFFVITPRNSYFLNVPGPPTRGIFRGHLSSVMR